MENKTNHELEREHFLKLQKAEANSNEELERIEAEIARIHAHEAERLRNPQPINTVADAITFLEAQCDYLAVQLDEIVPPHWKVVSVDGEFDEVFAADEVINFARNQRDTLYARSTPGSDKSGDPFPASGGAT